MIVDALNRLCETNSVTVVRFCTDRGMVDLDIVDFGKEVGLGRYQVSTSFLNAGMTSLENQSSCSKITRSGVPTVVLTLICSSPG